MGTGNYSTLEVMRQAHEESGAEIVTVAIRRVSLPAAASILDYIDTKRFTLLPNTAGCYTADEAIRTAYLAREAGMGEMVKLEVIGDPARSSRTCRGSWRPPRPWPARASPSCRTPTTTR